jgi:uncharacterized membrane protein
MLGLWSFVRFLHVLGAMVWVGGQLTITAVLLPVVRTRLGAGERAQLMTAVGTRFGIYTVVGFLPVQVITGLAVAAHNGVTVASLGQPGYGRTLLAKLVAFALVLLASGGHGWANGAGRPVLARALAIGSLVGSLGIVVLATALAQG